MQKQIINIFFEMINFKTKLENQNCILAVRGVEILITVFLSFNGSIAAYQSLQLDARAGLESVRSKFTSI